VGWRPAAASGARGAAPRAAPRGGGARLFFARPRRRACRRQSAHLWTHSLTRFGGETRRPGRARRAARLGPRRRAAPAVGSRGRPGACRHGAGRREAAEQTAALVVVGDGSDAAVIVALGGWQPRQTCPPSSTCHARLVGPTAQCSWKRGCTQAENQHVFGCKDLLAPLTVPCGQIFSTSGLQHGFAWIALVNFISQEAPRGGADGECKRTQFHAATLRFGVRQQPDVSNPARILR